MCNNEGGEREIKMIIGGMGIPIIKMKTYKYEAERSNIKDEGDKYIVTLEMPGVRREDIKLYVNEKTIEATAKPSTKLPGGEREYKYKIKLEDPVEVEGVKAKYFEGLLIIELPKKRTGREVKVE
jgi:HSP20 family protein